MLVDMRATTRCSAAKDFICLYRMPWDASRKGDAKFFIQAFPVLREMNCLLMVVYVQFEIAKKLVDSKQWFTLKAPH